MTTLARRGLRPPARRSAVVDELHGRPVADPYRWLEDATSPETAMWQAGQDELFEQVRDGWAARPAMLDQLTELLAVGYVSPPQAFGDRLFYHRLEPGQEYAVLVALIDGIERVVVDPLAWDPSGASTLEAWQPSWSGELVAVQFSVGGAEDSQLYVLRTATGEILDGPIDRVRKSAVGWLPDGERFYYVRRLAPELVPGEERYHRRVYLHRLGTDPSQDVLIFGEGRDRTEFYSVSVQPPGPLLVLTGSVGAGAGASRDVWIADVAGDAASSPRLRPVQSGMSCRTTVRSGADPDTLYLQTDSAAVRGRVVAVSAAEPDRNWDELVAEDPEAVLTDFAVLSDPVPVALVSRRRHAVSEIEVLELSGGTSMGLLELPGPGVTGRVSAAPDGRRAWFSFTDPGCSPIVLSYHDGTVSRWPAASSSNTEPAVITKQISFASLDGTEVRMFVMSATGRPDRPRPTILNGYGGFGAVMAPDYRAEALAWVRAGGVFAVACLRGGGEEGSDWHRAGTGLGKHRVFEDFEAAADELVGQGWTTPALLGIYGGSNGGLLVGAALTRRPESYAAVVCMAPLLDMVRYELSGMGPSWRREYGTVEDPAEFENLLAYSPFHAVRVGARYPSVLFTVFEGDSRVDLLHARKMCAALQHADGAGVPILLRTERGVGHGARTVSSGAQLLADCLAFFADRLGL